MLVWFKAWSVRCVIATVYSTVRLVAKRLAGPSQLPTSLPHLIVNVNFFVLGSLVSTLLVFVLGSLDRLLTTLLCASLLRPFVCVLFFYIFLRPSVLLLSMHYSLLPAFLFPSVLFVPLYI